MRLISFLKNGALNIEKIGINIFPRDRILSAISYDGILFKKEKGIRVNPDRSSSEEMVYYPFALKIEEKIRLYYHSSNNKSGTIVSRVSDDGLNFFSKPTIHLLPSNLLDEKGCFAPWIIQLEEGLFRMYYSGKDKKGKRRILSAVSKNGIAWEKENGIRIGTQDEIKNLSILDVAVIRVKDGYRAYFSGLTSKGCFILSAISSCGFVFEIEKGIRIGKENTGMAVVNNPSPIFLEDGRIRLYFRAGSKSAIGNMIYSAISSDGLKWEIEDGIRITPSKSWRAFDCHGVGFPNVIRLNHGYRIYYTGYWGPHLLKPLTVMRWKKPLL
ncbi:MAG: hypothetical protein DRG20_01890 [Deltaproteobacteria bacterium]|nr:hypothetical protein [Deltaproteobacteria bacterium]RLA91245.1 MAG: hypothetical protein DRG20_01890 [Deltaproteobacteria bacterium]